MTPLFAALVFSFFSSVALSAVLPSRYLVQELTKNSGAGVYQIEQVVLFPTAGEPIVLRETWWVANENTLRLQVTGLRELKDQFKLQYVYQGGLRYGLGASGRMQKKIGADFIEKYFHYRSHDRLLTDLVQMKLLPNSALSKKVVRSTKESDYKPEPLVRLGRTGGSVAFVFGSPAPLDGEPSAGFWIEQDTFALKKFRLPSNVEVIAEKHSTSPRGLLFPRTRTVRWGSNSVQIQTFNVSAKSGLKSDFFSSAALETVNKTDGIQNPALKSLVEEFYLRYR
ncbi:MAG: hypothetical protein ACK5P7_06940 [Bdellovibrio sp.]